MPFNKIQPEQIQLATFFSDSGDLNITQTDTGVQMNLSKNLTGNFAFTGQVLTNGKRVFGLGHTGSNVFDPDSGNLLFLGGSTEMGQDVNNFNNIALLTQGSNISGINNVAINTKSTIFQTGSQNNTIVAGNSVTFGKVATGSAVIKDSAATSLTVNDQNTLTVQFANGHFFEAGDNYFEGAASFNASGIFSGKLDVLSDATLSGSTIVNEGLLNGDRTITGTQRLDTGVAIPLWSGNKSQAGIAVAPATGALAISGATLLIQTGYNGALTNPYLWGKVAILGSP